MLQRDQKIITILEQRMMKLTPFPFFRITLLLVILIEPVIDRIGRGYDLPGW